MLIKKDGHVPSEENIDKGFMSIYAFINKQNNQTEYLKSVDKYVSNGLSMNCDEKWVGEVIFIYDKIV